jgi:long-chain acyl-CoA synthetase
VYPKWPWTWPVRLLRVGFLELAMRPLVWLLGAPRVMRTGELPAGPMLLIANHVTAYDGALVLYALPRRLRQHVAIAMSGEMLEDFRHGRKQGNALLDLLGPMAWLLITALFNVFPLPRQQGFRRSFAHAGEALDHGDSVMIFPEGTRSRDGRMHAFRQGIGLLAVESAVPVLPVALVGLGELTAAKQRWFRSGKLEVRVGKPIPVDAAAEPADVTARLELAVRELLGE